MTNQDILDEVATSQWQPKFTFTDDLDKVVDSILKPHEDYFLELHSKVKEIIERETSYAETVDTYQITFADVSNWQKELFEYKRETIDKLISPSDFYDLCTDEEFDEIRKFKSKVANLPNQHINLGLRDTNVKVGKWIPPAPMFLENLKEMCFPVKTITEDNDITVYLLGTRLEKEEGMIQDKDFILEILTDWYKIFQSVHFYNDLNGRVGGIVINIISYILTGKYLIK